MSVSTVCKNTSPTTYLESTKPHVNQVARTCFFYLHRLRQVKCYMSHYARLSICFSALILSRLDYCNSMIVGLSWSTVTSLQRVQNTATQLCLDMLPCDHICFVLKELHWLPVHYAFNTSWLCWCWCVFYTSGMPCCWRVRTPVSTVCTHRTIDYIVPRTRTQFREWAFCVAGPTAWNFFLESLRSVSPFPVLNGSSKHTFKIYTLTAFSLLFSCSVLSCTASLAQINVGWSGTKRTLTDYWLLTDYCVVHLCIHSCVYPLSLSQLLFNTA